MVAGLRAGGWTVGVRELDDSFPRPTAAALDDAARVLAAIPDGTTVVIDGLAFGAMPAEVEREASRLRLVALVHMPLAAEIGLDADTAARLEASEGVGLGSSASWTRSGWRPATTAPICSYWPRCMRPTGWRSPRRSRAGCRSSVQQLARFQTSSVATNRLRAYWFPPETLRRSPAR